MNNKPIATAHTDHVETNKKCNVQRQSLGFENEKQNAIDK